VGAAVGTLSAESVQLAARNGLTDRERPQTLGGPPPQQYTLLGSGDDFVELDRLRKGSRTMFFFNSGRITGKILVPFCMVESTLLYVFAHSSHESHETILFGASIVAGAFALFSYLRSIELRKGQAADQLIARWNNPDMRQTSKTLREIREGLLGYTSAMSTKRGTEFDEGALGTRQEIIAALGFFEEVALAIQTSTANEEKLRRYFEPVMIQGFGSLKKWIEAERDTDNEPTYYTELEAVVDRWKNLRTRNNQAIR
jgi:hypothetical protein